MWLSLSEQTAYFLWSLPLGAALAAVYDLVRAGRMLLRAGNVHVMISDILFSVFCGLMTSLFALPFNKGDVRGFIIFGEAVGFLVYRLTIGSIMGKIYARSAVILRKIIQKLHKYIEIFFDFLLKIVKALLYNIDVVIDKSRRAAADKRKSRRAAFRKKKVSRRRNRKQKYEQKGNKKTRLQGGKARTAKR